MADINDKKKRVYEQMGEDGLDFLREMGIDVDAAITNILAEEATQQDGLETQAESGTVDTMMTSELAYNSGQVEDAYGQEFIRRLDGIDLKEDQISRLYTTEQLIVSADETLRADRAQPWVRRYFIFPDSTPETMPAKERLTLSELTLITDDANAGFWRDHHTLPDEALAALCIAACCAAYTEARYAHEFNKRTETLGWSKAQGGAYTRNECLLIENLKWGHHDNPAWTPQTCDLKQYQRE